jgi:large subunit ribosomal protein L25
MSLTHAPNFFWSRKKGREGRCIKISIIGVCVMSTKVKFSIEATHRNDQGKGASRRLRRLHDQVPGIVYGGSEPAVMIAVDHKKLMHSLDNPAFYTHLLNLNLEGKTEQVVLKSLQRHHYKKGVMHLDLFRVKPTDVITMKIPLHFLGEQSCPGVKDQNGVVSHQMMDLEIRCQAQHLPEFIEVDISKMELGQALHISHLKLPKGVESIALSHGPEHDHPVVNIHLPRTVVEEVAAPETAETPTLKDTEAASAKGGTQAPQAKGGASASTGGKPPAQPGKDAGKKGK